MHQAGRRRDSVDAVVVDVEEVTSFNNEICDKEWRIRELHQVLQSLKERERYKDGPIRAGVSEHVVPAPRLAVHRHLDRVVRDGYSSVANVSPNQLARSFELGRANNNGSITAAT